MSPIELIGPGLAFMAALPPEWRDPYGRDALPTVNLWVVGLVAWFALLLALTPLALALSAYRQQEALRTSCAASGGRLTHTFSDRGGGYHCSR